MKQEWEGSILEGEGRKSIKKDEGKDEGEW
jgi:hypothetical protein